MADDVTRSRAQAAIDQYLADHEEADRAHLRAHATPDRVATPIWVVTANCGDYYCEGNHVLAVCTSPEMAAQKVEEAKQAKHVYIRRTGKRDDYNAWREIEVEERVLDEVVKGTLTDQRAR